LGWTIKCVDKGHLKELCQLEIVGKHTDPADRIIIAQAIAESITLISSDKRFPKYKEQGLDLIKNFQE
jgi:PIN domain nuclease of toxin-antitoxin system